VRTVLSLWSDGSILAAYHFAEAKVQDHIVEPMTKLGMELFDTIRKREEVVTREECDESRESLHRMLHDFGKTDRGSSLISDMKDRIKDTIQEQKRAAASVASKITGHQGSSNNKNGSSGGGDFAAASAAAAQQGARSAALSADLFTPEQAMSALMTAYEKELQHPVQGVVFGNLMTAILIQMQKLKVHTEAAMLKMDQVNI
jgi:hypothetical protein